MLRRLFLILILSGFSLIAFNQNRSLDFYLQEGLRNSPLLNDLRNQISSATDDSLLISASKKPLVEARSQLLYAPFYKNFGYDEVITDGGNYTGLVGVSQNIFNKKEVSNKYSSVELQKQLTDNSMKVSVNELKKIITDQYLTSITNYNDFNFNTTFLELLVKEDEIVKQFVISGICKQTDYLSLLIETQSQEILVAQLKNQIKKDQLQLNTLCGITDSVTYKPVEPEILINGSADISNSPSYIQYKIDSLRIENEKSSIDLRYRLKVNWFADAGFMTSTPLNFYKHFGYSAGVGLNIPIYDGKQKDLEKHKLSFDENSRKMYETNYKKKYFQQLQQFTHELKSLNEMSLQIEKQLITSEELVKALKKELEAGIVQMTEYINAIKNLRNITRNLNLINMQKLQVINEMNYLITQ
jgi:outer membrane protein TolC